MNHESWSHYRKKNTQEMRAYVPGEDLSAVSVSPEDRPEAGGMIARNADNPDDQWYVAKAFFEKNYEPAPFGTNAIYSGPQNGG